MTLYNAYKAAKGLKKIIVFDYIKETGKFMVMDSFNKATSYLKDLAPYVYLASWEVNTIEGTFKITSNCSVSKFINRLTSFIEWYEETIGEF